MSKKSRRKFTTEQRAAILRRHLVDKVSVSDLCDEYSLQPSVFYTWQRQLFENLEGALVDGRANRQDHAQRKIASLEQELADKDSVISRKEAVIAEVTEEYVGLKKKLGAQNSPTPGRRRT